MKSFLVHWFVSSIALAATAWVLPGVTIDTLGALLIGAIVLGFLNAVLKPILLLLTLPLTLVTLGLFYFVLNALMFALAAALVPGFVVAGFGWSLLAALVMGLFSSFLGSMLRSDEEKKRRR